ncbi:glycosyltransferase [Stenomitos frigidus]|uniref:Glycosyl transferase n=1 Tax=Stenomitos frigidus ULC18 TaxID=2107698 RepID=A0A2T1E552_9CYAN|nr:glycosyltransferase [Stenomitos frigidus]PSB27883.1 glycosyl transferase [Stenomitos frigidus ULC18]
MTTLLEILFVLLIGSSIVFYLTCAVFTHQFFTPTNKHGSTADHSSPPVSILVPVCGLDAGAWDNWSSFCLQAYPDYEVLFGVTDPHDPALPMLQKVVETYPDRARLFCGLEPRGINYKDSNLSYLLEDARHEVIIFADSDIRVQADYICTVTAPLADEKVGLVTCAFIGYHPRSVGAAMASFGRCFDFIPSLLIARTLDQGLRCAVGATIATRKATLASFGGLHFNRIGSDYNLGKRAAQAGYRIELSLHVLESDTGYENIAQVFQRELRWARTIRFNRGAQYYSMVFCYGTAYCFPLLLLSEFADWAIALSSVTFVIRYIQVLIAIFSINCLKLLPWLWALPLRDVLNFVVWFAGAFGQGVYWRGRQLRVEGDGLITQWE